MNNANITIREDSIIYSKCLVIEARIGELYQSIESLADKLYDIMLPGQSMPDTVEAARKERSQSKVCDKLDDLVIQVVDLQNKLECMLDRIQN